VVPDGTRHFLETARWESNDDYVSQGSTKAKKGGSIKVVSPAFPATLAPFGKTSNSTFNSMLRGLTYETLLDMDPVTLNYIPGLARRWAVASDKKTFFFEIDPRARWSDGKPVIASDVVVSWDMRVDPGIEDPFSNDFWGKFERPVALAERLVMFRSKELSWQSFMNAGTSLVVFPSHVLAGVSGKEFLTRFQWVMMPGSGPYKFESSKVNEEIILSRRRDWWQADLPRVRGYYNFDLLQFLFVQDENLIKEKFKKGDLDWLMVNVAREWHQDFIPAAVPALAHGWIQKRKVFTNIPVGIQGIAFNFRRSPFGDIRVRQAIAHLFNREKMMDKLFFNEYEYIDSFYPNSPFANPDNPKIRFDPDRAVELLEKAGWRQKDRDSEGWLTKEGKRFETELNFTSASTERYLTVFQEDLKDVGIKLNLKQVTWATDLKELGERSFGLSARAYSAGLFPNPESSFHSKFADLKDNNNIWGFKNRRIDEICDAYPGMFDPQERIKAVREIDAIAFKEFLYAFGWYSGHTRLLYWNKFGMPPYVLSKLGDHRSIVSLWWYEPDLERKLKECMEKGVPQEVGPAEVRWWNEFETSGGKLNPND